MQKGDIITLSLLGGEYIIGKLESEDADFINVNEPRRIQLIPKKDGFGIVFTPINIFVEKDFIDESIKIEKKLIFRVDNKAHLRQDIMDSYIKHISGVPGTPISKDHEELNIPEESNDPIVEEVN